jgi:hypothetical protein
MNRWRFGEKHAQLIERASEHANRGRAVDLSTDGDELSIDGTLVYTLSTGFVANNIYQWQTLKKTRRPTVDRGPLAQITSTLPLTIVTAIISLNRCTSIRFCHIVIHSVCKNIGCLNHRQINLIASMLTWLVRRFAAEMTSVLEGRPYGGCSVLWRSAMQVRVHFTNTDGSRLCAVRMESERWKFLLINVYMPYESSEKNSEEFCLQLPIRLFILSRIMQTVTLYYAATST